MAKRHDARAVPQAQSKHPDPWARDLEPNQLRGQNIGVRGDDVLYASQIKDLTRELGELTHDELAQIVVLPPGASLQQGAVYCDVSDPRRPVFTATGDMRVPDEHYVVPKKGVAFEHWNRLLETHA